MSWWVYTALTNTSGSYRIAKSVASGDICSRTAKEIDSGVVVLLPSAPGELKVLRRAESADVLRAYYPAGGSYATEF